MAAQDQGDDGDDDNDVISQSMQDLTVGCGAFNQRNCDPTTTSQISVIRLARELIAPDVLPFEIGNALTAMMKKRLIDADEVTSAWDSAQKIQVELYRTDIREALSIASIFNIYAYDAYFLECASSLKLPLLTLDRRLREIARKKHIKIIEVKT